MNRLLTTALLCLGLCFMACKKDKSEKMPPAIQAMADANGGNCGFCGPTSIELYEWKGQKVYLVICGGVTCYCIPKFYDAQGNRLDQQGDGYATIRDEGKFIKLLWTCKPAK